MEVEEEKLRSPKDDKSAKRRMKTPLQRETLEKVYAEEKYPSEAVRAELSVQLGLSDRQLKLWFCHRRLKDRKSKEDEEPAVVAKKLQQEENSPSISKFPALEAMHSASAKPKLSDEEEDKRGGAFYMHDEGLSRSKRPVEKRLKDPNGAPRKRSRHGGAKAAGPSSDAEVRAISSVEAQLGEPLRQDGPALGLEFDPLPPGAFGSPAVSLQHDKVSVARESQRHVENKAFERSMERFESKPHKNSIFNQTSHTGSRRRKTVDAGQSLHMQPRSRALQEYQFIPEQPSGRSEIGPAAYERTAHGKLFLGSENPLQTLTSHGSFLRSSDSLATHSFGLQGRLPNVEGGLLFHVDGHNNQLFSHSSGGFEGLHQDSLSGFGYDSQFGVHNSSFQLLPIGTSMGSSEKLSLLSEHEPSRMGRKRKSEEARIAKEIEAHKKRIRREIERQEVARRKREEQIRKELEKHDREKRREAERMVREKQREDERMKREQRRDYERREKLIQKETERLERQRQKEESRRLKEATKMKAAMERATARRLARESIELIDDERLELLEAAAISQGLPSIYLLDGETLQGLDRYRDCLKKFPPVNVRMKKPLSGSPWIDAQQNVGNLFMVWRFLTTFADVLGLWPFTIDEFVQAFHDYDPRLLGEIHLSLLKLLMKDIEDVAQASAAGAVVNQYTPAYTGGGHSQLVEAAFAWGFDIREWGQHLNPLTWPEVLRQFALAAGYGPRWKKQQVEMDDFHYVGEGNEGEEAVNTLRSGAAAANAVALMKGKGGFHARRSGYRLTPGTVKYAAFHVLSVEGENGLSILEVADRIQKSGLRDLTTSKTPEASIAAALSRDTKFFERVAPSTYSVRPAFRKDPEDAERLLQAARERVHLFQSGVSEVDDVEKDTEDVEEAERDDDSDDDVDDAAGDDIQGLLDEGKGVFCLKEGNVIECGENYATGEMQIEDSNKSLPLHKIDRGRSAFVSNVVDINKSAVGEIEGSMQLGELPAGTVTSTDTEIDESHAGEPWVQGLMEGEYSELSVEERLNALVALIEAVNEGNTVRTALEERMEAANALKRQMWAEAQLDKRRFKEEQLLKAQSQSAEGLKIDGSSLNAEESPKVEYDKIVEDDKALVETMAAESATGIQNDLTNSPPSEKGASLPGCLNQDMSITTASGFALDKTRAQLKADIGLRAEELYVYRSLPLGFDRRHNRYWQFVTCNAGEDPGCGRLYFESSQDCHWEVIDTEEAFDALMANLDTRGIREAHLHGILQKLESSIKQGMRKSGANTGLHRRLSAKERDLKNGHLAASRNSKIELAVSHHTGYISEEGSSGDGTVLPVNGLYVDVGAIPIQFGNTMAERQHALESYLEFDNWLWSKQSPEISGLIATNLGQKRSSDLLGSCEVCHEFYWVRDRHCPCCHATLEGFPKIKAKPSQHVHECEEKWRRKDASWKLHGSFRSLPSRVQLLKAQIVAVEAAIPAEALKPAWTETHRKAWAAVLKRASSPGELLQVLTELEGAVLRDWLSLSYETTEELLKAAAFGRSAGSDVLPWLPQTTAAVGLRLLAFDTALFYSIEQRQQSLYQPDQTDSNGGALATGKAKNSDSDELSPLLEEEKLDSWTDVGIGQPSGRNRARGGRPRGRGRSRGGGSGATRTNAVTDGSQKVSKSLHFSGGLHGTQAIKSGRQRGRGSRAFNLEKTIKGRGRGSRSGRRRQSRIQKKDWEGNRSLAGSGSAGMFENAAEREIRSDRVGSENEDWEAQESSDEQINNTQVFYSEEDEDLVGVEEDNDADQEELIIEDEYEEDEEDDEQYEEMGHARQGSTVYSDEDEFESLEAAQDEDEDEDEDVNDVGVDSHGISDDAGVEGREDESFESQSFDESE